MDFLRFVMENAGPWRRLQIAHMYDLWGMLFESPVMSTDPQAMLTFIKEVAADHATVQSRITPWG